MRSGSSGWSFKSDAAHGAQRILLNELQVEQLHSPNYHLGIIQELLWLCHLFKALHRPFIANNFENVPFLTNQPD